MLICLRRQFLGDDPEGGDSQTSERTSRETRPSLAEFVGPKSWLVFERLNLISSLDWMLEDDINRWVENQSYNNFCDFVMKFNCTNNEAERNIKMLCVCYSTKTALLSVVAEDVQEELAGAGL